MKKLSLVTLMTAAGLLSSTAAHAGYDFFNELFRVEGFGTLGAYQSNNNDVRARPDARARAGSEGDLRFDGDTILAVQGTVNPNGPIKGVIQMVSHKKIDGTTLDGSWRPLTEWGYLAWNVTPELNIKAGRVVAPLFLMSDSRNLGYSQTAVRPPQTVYQINPITNLDGLTGTWDTALGDATMSLTGIYGKTSVAVEAGQFKINQIFGGAFKVSQGDWTGRVAYAHMAADVNLTSTNQAQYAGIQGLGFCANCATEVAERAKLNHVKVKMFSYGAIYEHDDYVAQAEFVNRFGDTTLAPDVSGWYVQLAKRWGEWTPYVRYGEIATKDSMALQATGGANAGQQAVINSLNESLIFGKVNRSELALGARWDFSPKLALKAEYNMYKINNPLYGKTTVVTYPLFTPQLQSTPQATAFDGDQGRVHLMTLNLDFIF